MIKIVFTQSELAEWKNQYPVLEDVLDLKPAVWMNPNLKSVKDTSFSITREDIEAAENLWQRFAPFIEKEFPETRDTHGILESPLRPIPHMQEQRLPEMGGSLYLKCDNELPIAGSIKARGGIYEVLQYAEKLALNEGMVQKDDNYEVFATDRFKKFFNQYSIGVGSTGNLGLSIGIMSAALGFNISVYMSVDAKQWKKDLLRYKGANVLEYEGDFGKAIAAGREETNSNPNGYFIDDEDSKHLFLGYSVAALRLEKQLKEQNIQVDAEHPLFFYLPCGVGGSPGGVAFGMKQVFGDNAHCFFVEPTHSPSVLIGLATGEMEKLSVQDFGIDNKTEADGMAVGRPSKFATAISDQLVSGMYTIEDDELYRLLAMLADKEDIWLEPSATSGIPGPEFINSYCNKHNINMNNATHIAWATGGALVPEQDMSTFYSKGKNLT